ncbi:acyclic terpene utilization AtuA family protein [Noviherbaspirillum aerium]|uniref:acyclic terpene utilization AtuA family protein n=1 Tax=Noviherbaspirillum aerium TaxID=2588497 RepID=UPI00124D7A4B|nr:acyclic terpene utilization AtuA family protein [Noviherbaspirillum aerium]
MNTFLVGSAAGFSGDRTDAAPAVVDTMIRRGRPAALIFETLAERTLALAQLARRENPDAGYEPLLADMLSPVLAQCLRHRIRIVSNFGAANPAGAARRIHQLAAEQGLPKPRIAIVSGDEIANAEGKALLRAQMGEGFDETRFVCANAYIGAAAIAGAIRAGADIVVCGRVADPSLTLGPVLAHFNWHEHDWDRLARATMAGHLLECGAQVTGGYFADPGYKDVPDLARVGYPIVEIDENGDFDIGKSEPTGGIIDTRTVTEQLLYELHDPAAYLTPDVIADISNAEVRQTGNNRVAVTGIRGHARPARLKANIFYEGGWLAEGEISYAGPRAGARARLAMDILRQRLPHLKIRFDLIGVMSVFGDDDGAQLNAIDAGALAQASDVRLRAACTHEDKHGAALLLREVVALYTCGPAGGGGVRTSLRSRLNATSCEVPRETVSEQFSFVEQE